MIKVKKNIVRNTDQFTYPTIRDKEFQLKISKKKEFDYKYDSGEKSCDNTFFTLAPHQEFVKRFISYNSYYNGLLLYHGLGSGKTCSAIGITEETRKYIKYSPTFKPIIIVASTNVQSNFKLQLFDENKLKKINGQWVIHGCLGSALLDEIGLSQVNHLDKETIIKKIKKLIRKYYIFKGYIEFGNIISNIGSNIEKLKLEFEDRMIVIDEIHNIRTTSDGKSEMQKVVQNLEFLVSKIKYMKLIFLTGTPMFNGAEEIIFMLNILNLNDKQKQVKKNKIFKKDGSFQEDGEEQLIRMANGYISYVRGENPYTFPHLVPPQLFDESHSLIVQKKYPSLMFNETELNEKIEHLDLYLSTLNTTQLDAYKDIMKKMVTKKGKSNQLNYTETLLPLQTLNICYPNDVIEDYDSDYDSDFDDLTQDKVSGIKELMTWELSGKPKVMHSFRYKNETNPLFKRDKIGEYSTKIKTIIDQIQDPSGKTAHGVILIYSQWIYYGVLPMALALEELGYSRFGSKTQNLINNEKNEYTYSIICGNNELSPDINEDIDALTNHNTNGEKVKIVIISQSGAEGIDLKNIRQVHILEPWFNMNRIEQVIGRARRNCSHKELSLDKRNVQVYLHSVEPIKTKKGSIEPIDMYLYRLGETKNKMIGKVSKILKQVSVDCLLNESQKNFSRLETKINLTLSNGKKIKDYPIKDKPYTNICDYQETCEYVCVNQSTNEYVDISTYNYKHIANDQILYSLKLKFKERHIYVDKELKEHLQALYPFMKEDEYEYAVDKLMNEDIYDKYNERGKIVKIHDLLLFQPDIEDYEYITSEDRMNPILRADYVEMEPITITLEVDEIYKSFEQSITDTMNRVKKTQLYKLVLGKELPNSLLELFKNLEQKIIERNFDYLNMNDQLHLLHYITKENIQPMKDIIYKCYVKENTIVLNDTTSNLDKRGTIEVYTLQGDTWEKTNDVPLFIDKPNASYIGYIKLISQSKKNKRPEFAYNPKNDIMTILNELMLERKEKITTYYTKLGIKIDMELILELYLRYLEEIDTSKKYFYYKHEIKEIKID